MNGHEAGTATPCPYTTGQSAICIPQTAEGAMYAPIREGPLVKLSPGFLAALVGIAMTVLAWSGRWEWPSWPVFIAMRLIFGVSNPFDGMTTLMRNGTVVFFFALNIAVWGFIVWLLMLLVRKFAARY